ncbi:hypothetical protein QBC46DRAFT_439975 [Diplogelasinospora grovesii]|uniref:Uncharacterized protein n=1 Tax=Diplogelasinospora grovesii TaxID=303347 RepID=A0AAN6N3N2_9PEZI|nr:hypothetical protein QBC46DRAFT_439975 [Diplogelasinospora grovesii]
MISNRFTTDKGIHLPAVMSHSDHLESKRQRAHALFQHHEANPIPDRPAVGNETEYNRERAWQAWNAFFLDTMEINPAEVWFNLCNDLEEAKSYCRTFLQSYVENSEELCPCLGLEEYEWKRTVTSAVSVLNVWRSLIGMADSIILLERRRQDPKNKSLWTLKYVDPKPNGKGPVHKITMWIYEELPDITGLTREQQFDKMEVIASDIVLMLSTLWTCVKDIPYEPRERTLSPSSTELAAGG